MASRPATDAPVAGPATSRLARLRRRLVVWRLQAIQRADRRRLRRLMRRHPGLRVAPGASTNFAFASYQLGPGATLRIAAGATTERRRDGIRFDLGPGAQVEVGPDVWLRSDLGPVHVVAFEGARIRIGPEAFLNGCHVSAKRLVVLGRRAFVGPGSRIFDADQHDLDADTRERSAPVEVGDHVWIASDVTVLRGVRIGAHSVVGARSVVTRDLPSHVLAFGAPARPVRPVGDRAPTSGPLR